MLWLCAALATAAPLDKVLDDILDDPAYAGATATALVVELDSGAVLYEREADRRVLPASVVKWVTAVAAAERLGLDHTFETSILATGPVKGGVLSGDLVIRGDGDPSLGGDVFDPALALFGSDCGRSSCTSIQPFLSTGFTSKKPSP